MCLKWFWPLHFQGGSKLSYQLRMTSNLFFYQQFFKQIFVSFLNNFIYKIFFILPGGSTGLAVDARTDTGSPGPNLFVAHILNV